MSYKPKFLYFDLGNVIAHFDHERMCRQLSDASGVELNVVRQLLLTSPLLRMIEVGELDNRGWHEVFCRETKSRPELNQFLMAVSDIFWLNVEIVPVLAQLAAAAWPLGILSNTCQAHWEFLSQGRFGIIPELFEQTVLSYQVHALKPELEIFSIAGERAGCKPSEIFYTDDRQENVDGALRAGWDAVLFTDVATLVSQLRSRGVGFNY